MNEIAVAIPCFNLGRLVEEALDSVLTQSRPAAEIVIIDDGSTDLYSRQVLAKIEQPRTRVVRTANRGAAAARNYGIRLTSAPFIVALDGDDMLEPSYLEATARCLEAKPAVGFVTTAYQAFGDASYVWTPSGCDLTTALTEGSAHVASMLRRELWEKVGGFDETLRTAEDFDFWISALEHDFEGYVLTAPLLRRRVRKNSKHRQNVADGGYERAMTAIVQKHRQTVERLGLDLLLARESLLLGQRAHQRRLETRKALLEQKEARLQKRLASLTGQLRQRQRAPLDWGDLGRLRPLNPVDVPERGTPLDRYYIEAFLEKHRSDVKGRVLETKGSTHSERLASQDITERVVLDTDPRNPRATIIAELAAANIIPSDHFDCLLLTQLDAVYDVRAAMAHAYRILKPGGVLLCSLPAAGPTGSRDDNGDDPTYWRFTEAGARRLVAEFFPLASFDVQVFGNVMACTGFLHGLATKDLNNADLDQVDPSFPLVLGVRAVKPGAQGTTFRGD